MALRDAIDRIQTHAKAAGVKEAPTDPTEANIGFPFSVCYVRDGDVLIETERARRDVVNLYLDYHLNRQNLPTDVRTSLDFFQKFPNYLILDPTLNGTVSTIIFGRGTGIHFEFGNLEYGSLKTVGYRFTIPIKMRTEAVTP